MKMNLMTDLSYSLCVFCLQACVELAQRSAASSSMTSRCQKIKLWATSEPVSAAPTLPSCEYSLLQKLHQWHWTCSRICWHSPLPFSHPGWIQWPAVRCVSDLQPPGWRISSATWRPKMFLVQTPTCKPDNNMPTLQLA